MLWLLQVTVPLRVLWGHSDATACTVASQNSVTEGSEYPQYMVLRLAVSTAVLWSSIVQKWSSELWRIDPPKSQRLHVFAKIAEGFVTGWVLDDVERKIDKRQFGNVKGVSTAHYLVSLVHYLPQGADKSHNVGTVVLTDFSKAFDLVGHTILIEKMIRMGIRTSIVPRICDFLHNRQQCVRFNDVLSDYVPLHGGIPQGIKLDPIGFQINEAAENSSSKCLKYVDDLTFADESVRSHCRM